MFTFYILYTYIICKYIICNINKIINILSTLNFHTLAQRRNSIISLIYKMIVNDLMFDLYNTSFAEL